MKSLIFILTITFLFPAYANRCPVIFEAVVAKYQGNDLGNARLHVDNAIVPEKVVENWKATPGYRLFVLRSSGAWNEVSKIDAIDQDLYVKFKEPNSEVELAKRAPASELLKTLFAVRPATDSQAGTIHLVMRSDGTLDLGECVSISLDGKTMKLRLNRTSKGETLFKEVSVEETANLEAKESNSSNSPNHLRVRSPSSIPDGSRFPSLHSVRTVVIDRKNDKALKDFLDKNTEAVNRNFWGANSVFNKVDKARKLVQEQVKFANDNSQHAKDYELNDNTAAAENRGLYVGDALLFQRGVCKDYALLTTLLLQNAGVNARYVSGEVSVNGKDSRHAWMEFQDESGKWYAVEPQQLEDALSLDTFYNITHPSGWTYKRQPSIVEFYRH